MLLCEYVVRTDVRFEIDRPPLSLHCAWFGEKVCKAQGRGITDNKERAKGKEASDKGPDATQM